MNDIAEFLPSSASGEGKSPRPPAVGRENASVFHEVCRIYRTMDESTTDALSCAETFKESIKPSDCRRYMQQDVPFRLSECGDTAYNNSNDNSSPSLPPPYWWARNLTSLLEDVQGGELFAQFLKQEGHDSRCLDFWFGCRGLKKTDPENKEQLRKLINVMYEKKVKRISAISQETKTDIKMKLLSNSCLSVEIFDMAQVEVEAYMRKTTYPNFLNSDLYLRHLDEYQSEKVERECRVSPEPAKLPTVHEDSELKTSGIAKFSLTKDNLSQKRSKSVAAKCRTEGQVGSPLKSPYTDYSAYHTNYAPYLPASAQDSELQSISSGALTDDTVSQADSSVDFPMYRSRQKHSHKAKYFGVLNNDKLSQTNFIPRTDRLPDLSHMHKTPEEFHALLVKKLNKVIEEQKMKEKVSERLKNIDSSDCAKSDTSQAPSKPQHKPSEPLFDPVAWLNPSEDDAQDILDQHVKIVYKDLGQTPAMSPGYVSPPFPVNEDARSRVAQSRQSDVQSLPQDLSYSSQRIGPVLGSSSIRHRKDVETRSNDSGAVCEWKSENNLRESSAPQDDLSHGRRSKEQMKRYIAKKLAALAAESSSCVDDSGVSVACESTSSHTEVSSWLTSKHATSESEKEWKHLSTSPVLSRSSSSRRGYRMDTDSSSVSLCPGQPLAQDSMMPMLPPPDTTTNLLEAKRRLEDENRPKSGKFKYASGVRSFNDIAKGKLSSRACDYEEGLSHRKQSRKSTDNVPGSSGCNDVTIVGYSYGRLAVPYLSRLPGKNITLKHFKTLLNKKGNFRYFFKKVSNDFGTGLVFEEVTDDHQVLPLWEGKVFCVIDCVDDPPLMSNDFSM